MRKLTRVEEAVLLLIKAYPKGSYEKIEEGYSFEMGDENNCIVIVSSEYIEFKIRTIRWVPGSYEPIEDSEVYTRIEYNEIDRIDEEKKLAVVKETIEKVIGKD